jgi:hypothetical protein
MIGRADMFLSARVRGSSVRHVVVLLNSFREDGVGWRADAPSPIIVEIGCVSSYVIYCQDGHLIRPQLFV